MLLNEIVKEVGMTKRAIKYYEEQGILTVSKDENGYRNYTEEDIRILKNVSLYRKLGIGIKDIRHILTRTNLEKEKLKFSISKQLIRKNSPHFYVFYIVYRLQSPYLNRTARIFSATANRWRRADVQTMPLTWQA